MNIWGIVKRVIPESVIKAYWRWRLSGQKGIAPFRSSSNTASDVRADIQRKYGHDSELLEFFVSNKGRVVHKWHHYIPIYDRYFSCFRERRPRVLEIGVSKGGSLQLWKKYFGEGAIIFGIDINPECRELDGLAGQVRIGSQVDTAFLDRVVREMGGLDVVLDDGSHQMDHIVKTLEHLFPHLSDGGVYMIEDLHTAYWRRFGGGYRSRSNFFRVLLDVVDDMHHWYHTKGVRRPLISNSCTGVHVHDSIVVLEKNRVYAPVHSEIG